MSKPKHPGQPAKDWAALLADMTKQRDDLNDLLLKTYPERDAAENARDSLTKDLAAKSALLTETARERDALRAERDELLALAVKDEPLAETQKPETISEAGDPRDGDKTFPWGAFLFAVLVFAILAWGAIYGWEHRMQVPEPTAVPSSEATTLPTTTATALPTPTAGPQSVESNGIWHNTILGDGVYHGPPLPTPHATPTDDDYGDYGGKDRD